MSTKLTRYILSFTDAQLAELRLRYPGADNDKQRVYLALGFEPPPYGGARPGAGRKPKIIKLAPPKPNES